MTVACIISNKPFNIQKRVKKIRTYAIGFTVRQNKVIGTELSEIKFTSMSLAEGLFFTL